MTKRGFSLMEVMVALTILASAMVMLSTAMRGGMGWGATMSAQAALAEDTMSIWKTMTEDFVQSSWYADPQLVFKSTLSLDRADFYLPYVYQLPEGESATQGGVPQESNLAPFFRSQTGGVVFSQRNAGTPIATNLNSSIADFDALDLLLPGAPADRTRDPSQFTGTSYRTSYYARSQSLVFVKATTTIWDRRNQRPLNVAGMTPDKIPSLAENFNLNLLAPGSAVPTSADWKATNNHAALGILHSSQWTQDPTTQVWTQRAIPSTWNLPAGTPYGQVMEAARLYSNNGLISPVIQVDQAGQPDYGYDSLNSAYVSQPVTSLRLYSYVVVPSPKGRGLGRLVRVYKAASGSQIVGVDSGCRISQVVGGNCLVVDKVLSDNVVRILFETARHNPFLGVNNIKATIFLAKQSENGAVSSSPVVHQCISMIFAMQADASAANQVSMHGRLLAQSANVLPFSY